MNFHEKTADLLYKAVKRSSVSPLRVSVGDVIVITGETDDIVGTVCGVSNSNNGADIKLKTTSGVKTYKVDDDSFIHVIQRVAMLDLRKHHQYERTDEKSNKEVDMSKKLLSIPTDRPQFSVENSDKSVLPTSKVSLSLQKTKEA